jgi:hypothetical protein
MPHDRGLVLAIAVPLDMGIRKVVHYGVVGVNVDTESAAV